MFKVLPDLKWNDTKESKITQSKVGKKKNVL